MRLCLQNSVLPAAVVALSFFANTCSAALVSYEGFEYTANIDINGQTGGTGWTAGWANVGGGTMRQTRAPRFDLFGA